MNEKQQEKEDFERRWGWLASLIAATIVAVLRLILSVLKLVFSILSALARNM